MVELSLRSLLNKIGEDLRKKNAVRGEVQIAMRRATHLSKQAILFIHQEKLGDAKKLLEEASEFFNQLLNISKTHQEMVYVGVVDAAFQEYAEAQILLQLVEENRFIDPKKLGVPAISYVLGLADVIGELRRRSLDLLRKGDVKIAENCLQTMDHIYVELMSMDEAYMLVPGLRRKSDIARRIIESTRGDITIEARRSSLEESIKNFEKTLKSKKKS